MGDFGTLIWPLLVIAGSKADTLFWSEEVYKKAKEPKELHIVKGATHIDMYDRPQFVTPAVAKLTAFFDSHLGQGGGIEMRHQLALDVEKTDSSYVLLHQG